MGMIVALLVFAIIAIKMAAKVLAKAKEASSASSKANAFLNFDFEKAEPLVDDWSENVEAVEKKTKPAKAKVGNIVEKNGEEQKDKAKEQSKPKGGSFPLKEAVIYSTILDRPYK